MKILITGSNGYVGNFLAEHFSRQGIPVVGLDIASMPRQRDYPNFRFVKCDVRDKPLVRRIFADELPTHVIHLAYLMDPQHDALFEWDVDVYGSMNVFIAAHDTSSVVQFIHFSSASVYGGWPDNTIGITEERRPRPRDWVYAQNKVWVEDHYLRFAKRADFKLVNFRMCTAVGPSYYKPGGVVAVLAKSPVGLLLDGSDAEIQFIHEDDVKALVGLVLADAEIEGVFNLAADSYSCQREMNPNSRKIFLSLPKRLFKAVIALLWKLRLSSVSPTSVNLIAHGIVVSPKKLQERYGYSFRYSTREAFFDAYHRRKENGTL
ncbi:MAG: NAD-dependent epimerase/dehydratase family protein [Patescibacteria group bacterium]|jgi:nucleoside-diphosphate-sugar epimerase